MKSILVWIGCLLATGALGQERFRVVSYNVENLFDIYDDPSTRDEDFTPGGRLYWTKGKYVDKLLKLAKAIEAAGEGSLPVFVGLCEVENRQVVTDLVTRTGLSKGNYRIVHKDSPDRRGIDVAFLYNSEKFNLLKEEFFRIPFPEDTTILTRDILYASGVLAGKDTLHFFVCHFPSMYGGEFESEWKRKRAAEVVKFRVDSILSINPRAGILILGDLNGKANRPALTEVLKARNSNTKKIKTNQLYNTGYYLLNKSSGSYRYKGFWQTIDHIIVSGALLNGEHTFQSDRQLKPLNAPFLLEEDKAYFGYKPFRTYIGLRYQGGYSDHLPIYLDLR